MSRTIGFLHFQNAIRALSCVGLAVSLWGCKTSVQHLAAADEDAYAILRDKEKQVHGDEGDFAIRGSESAKKLLEMPSDEIIKRQEKAGETVVIRTQADALALAVKNNRDFQRQRETLFLAALSLSDTRHSYDSIFSHSTTAERSRTSDGRDSGDVGTKLSVSKLLQAGGSLGITLANNLFEYYSGDPSRTATSILSVSITQPLLRGAGSDIAAEKLTQAERNAIYAVRSFSRYQKTFAVGIVSNYYRLVQQRDTVINEYENYQKLVEARKRARALSKDRLPEFEVDQTRQRELLARDRYILAVSNHLEELDDFKVKLGLTLDTMLQITTEGLDELRKEGLTNIRISAEEAFGVALQKRLDFLTNVDQYDDARRKVNLAEDQLSADLEFFANASLGSTGGTKFERFNFKDWSGGVGLRLKLPLDRLLERNSYRRELIDFEQEMRSLAAAVDDLKTDVRGALRNLNQRAKSYRNQSAAVELAKRRVESANLLLQAGRAVTRDLLEAQDDLVEAQNSQTGTLVDYRLARLALLRDMGTMDLENGIVVERYKIDTAIDSVDEKEETLISPEQLFGKE